MDNAGQLTARLGPCQAGRTITRDDTEHADWKTPCGRAADELLTVTSEDGGGDDGAVLIPLCRGHMKALDAVGLLHPYGG